MNRSLLVIILAVFLSLALSLNAWCAQRESVSGSSLQRTVIAPVQSKATSVSAQSSVQNTSNVASAQPKALQPRIDILSPADGTILEEGMVYKVEWRTFAIAPGSTGSIVFQCGPQSTDNTNPNTIANSLWCIHNRRELAANAPLEGSVNVTMHKVEHPLYHSGDIYEYEISVAFINKPDQKKIESIKKVKVKIK